MKIHHIAYAVKSIEKSRIGFEILGYREIQPVVEDEQRGIHISFMEHGDSGQVIELIEPAADENPVGNYLKKMKGIATPYHICYETEDLDKALQEFMDKGFIVTAEPAPAPAIDGRRVAFLIQKSVGVIELLEEGKTERL